MLKHWLLIFRHLMLSISFCMLVVDSWLLGGRELFRISHWALSNEHCELIIECCALRVDMFGDGSVYCVVVLVWLFVFCFCCCCLDCCCSRCC